MSDNFSIHFFHIANLLILTVVAWWIYRRYFKTRIEEKINQKEAIAKGLIEQGYFLEGRAAELSNQLELQEKKANTIKEKLEQWKKSVFLDQSKKEHENSHYQTEIADRIAKKNELFAQRHYIKMMMPDMLNKAELQLQAQFKDAQENATFLHEIVSALKGLPHE